MTDTAPSMTRTPAGARATERYTIRKQIVRFIGAGFDIFDERGDLFGYCNQKGFKLREDIRIYTDRTKSEESFRLATRQIIDFGATYDVLLSTGEVVGSLRRKGLKSTFVRDEWRVFNAEGIEAGLIREKNAWLAVTRRVIDAAAAFCPQTFEVMRADDETPLATFRQHFNPFVYRLGVTIHDDRDADLDELVLLAAACLLAAIEGRQR